MHFNPNIQRNKLWSSKNVSYEKSEIVHSDIWGPFRIKSIGGARYYVLFIDDMPRYIKLSFLTNKNEIPDKFKKYKAETENLTGTRIKYLRSDNRKEYFNRVIAEFLLKNGIRRQLTVEYSPQQNVVSERINKTLCDIARCFIIQGNFNEELWAEIINTAVHIIKRCPTRMLKNKTPQEVWPRINPAVKYFRTIWSTAYVFNHRRDGNFTKKSEKYVLIGYSEESKTYRLWKPKTNKIIKARNLKIIEPLHEIKNMKQEKQTEE